MPWLLSNDFIPEVSRLESLPRELLDNIFSHLDLRDFKALRFCGRLLEDVAVQYVFRRVVVSPLKRHIEALLNIGKDSRLSQFPEHLAWYEIDITSLVADFANQDLQWHAFIEHRGGTFTRLPDPTAEPFIASLRQELLSYFHPFSRWDEPLITDTGTSSHSQEVCERRFQGYLEERRQQFLPHFIAALEPMKRLRTFESRPSPYDLVITNSGLEFVAAYLNYRPVTRNQGLIMMLKYLVSSKQSIKTLHWADLAESSTTPFLTMYPGHLEAAFASLTKIDLCLGTLQDDREQNVLVAALYNAENLRHLKICFEHTNGGLEVRCLIDHRHRGLEQDSASVENGTRKPRPYWKYLQTLELEEVRFDIRGLLELLCRHAGTLRHLSLDSCGYQLRPDPNDKWGKPGSWRHLLESMAELQTLDLHSFRIHAETQFKDPADIERATQKVDSIDAQALVSFVSNRGPSPFRSDASPDDYLFISTSDVYTPNQRWKKPSNMTQWDSESVSDWDDPDRDVPIPEDEIIPPDDIDYAEDAGLIATSYWTLKRVQNHIVWWDSPTAEPNAYLTEQWLFEHPDGEFAYGKEPLDFFDDWGSELGDESDDDEENDDEVDRPASKNTNNAEPQPGPEEETTENNDSNSELEVASTQDTNTQFTFSFPLTTPHNLPLTPSPPGRPEVASTQDTATATTAETHKPPLPPTPSSRGKSAAQPAQYRAIETPFGPSFHKFCAASVWEPYDSATLEYPSHAMVLLPEHVTVPWPQFQARCFAERKSWVDVTQGRVKVGLEKEERGNLVRAGTERRDDKESMGDT